MSHCLKLRRLGRGGLGGGGKGSFRDCDLIVS